MLRADLEVAQALAAQSSRILAPVQHFLLQLHILLGHGDSIFIIALQFVIGQLEAIDSGHFWTTLSTPEHSAAKYADPSRDSSQVFWREIAIIVDCRVGWSCLSSDCQRVHLQYQIQRIRLSCPAFLFLNLLVSLFPLAA